MPLINCKIHLDINWIKHSVMYGSDPYVAADNNNNRETTFKITNKRLYASIATLSTKDKVKLTKQLNEGFRGPVYWNQYKSKIDLKDLNNNEATDTRIYLNASFQGAKRFFVIAFNNTDNGGNKVKKNCHKKDFFRE